MRDYRTTLFIAGLLLASPPPLRADSPIVWGPFHKGMADSKVVVYGQLAEVRGTRARGSAKMAVVAVIKAHPALGGREVPDFPRYLLAEDAKEHSDYLLFADVTADGRPDFYRAVLATGAVVDYLKGLVSLDGKDRAAVLRYCADYMEHKDPLIADDVFAEFDDAPDSAVREAAKHLSAQSLRDLALSDATPPQRAELYAFLLGHCGAEQDARALRGLLDRKANEEGAGSLMGILKGYTLLKRDEGWAYIRGLAADAKAPFLLRYAGLRVARFFHNTRPGVVPEKDILALLGLLLDQPDMADLPIEDLRKWRCWDMTDRILPLYGRKSYDVPIVKRTILRYALQCPHAAAKAFIAARRKAERELVEDVEESLRWEAVPAKP